MSTPARKLMIISGSHRLESQSERVGHFIEKLAQKMTPAYDTDFFTLAGNPLPLFDTDLWSMKGVWPKVWAPIQTRLRAADCFVVISPEWNGMVPPGLKNFFTLCSNQELGHKPAMIVTVSAGTGGAYPVAELRMSSYKNNHLCWIPEHVIVRHAETALLDPEKSNSKEDDIVRVRLSYGLKLLAQYSMALQQVRESGVVDHKAFANGM